MELVPRDYCSNDWLRQVIAGRNNTYSFVCNFGDDVLISKRINNEDHLYIVKKDAPEGLFYPPNRPNKTYEVYGTHLPWHTVRDGMKVDAYVVAQNRPFVAPAFHAVQPAYPPPLGVHYNPYYERRGGNDVDDAPERGNDEVVEGFIRYYEIDRAQDEEGEALDAFDLHDVPDDDHRQYLDRDALDDAIERLRNLDRDI